MESTRRDLLKQLGVLLGAVVLTPTATGCSSTQTPTPSTGPAPTPLALPRARPTDWDAIAFNRARGNAGAVPETYRPQINGPDAERQHIGKHLPYTPTLAAGVVPAGMIGLMFGDPSLGRTRHPNDAVGESAPHGHWFSWVKVRKATDDDAPELESRFGGWPTPPPDGGRFIPQEGTDLTADHGKNTVYLVNLPPGVGPGDLIRVQANCISHGEYVEFLTVPRA
ncbi:MAG: hypothetical protein U0325_25780 [Polyangiales bacterium]